MRFEHVPGPRLELGTAGHTLSLSPGSPLAATPDIGRFPLRQAHAWLRCNLPPWPHGNRPRSPLPIRQNRWPEG